MNSIKTEKFSVLKRLQSIGYAVNGILSFFKTQHNAIIHLCSTVTVVMAGLFFAIPVNEWLAIILVTGFVWVAEVFNTAIEAIMDHVSPEQHPKVKYIKDVAAAAVLLAAITAVVTGGLIFIPKLF